MVFDLEEPFKSLYRKSYLREDKFGRKRVDLVNSEKDRTTIAYARYLMCVKVGYVLSNEYEVDHIDRDCSNDDITNLQILTKEDHLYKTSLEMTTGRNTKIVNCACCGKLFEREVRQIRYEKQLCSRVCNGKLSNNLKEKALNEFQVSYIRDKFIKSDRCFGIAALAREFGVNKATIASALYKEDY